VTQDKAAKKAEKDPNNLEKPDRVRSIKRKPQELHREADEQDHRQGYQRRRCDYRDPDDGTSDLS
jgi:hypothetical protein